MAQNTYGLNRYYNVQLMSLWNNADIANTQRRFKGAAWARNVCFTGNQQTQGTEGIDQLEHDSQLGIQHQFIDEMVSRYGQEYNFGLPEYRAQSETLVDP